MEFFFGRDVVGGSGDGKVTFDNRGEVAVSFAEDGSEGAGGGAEGGGF